MAALGYAARICGRGGRGAGLAGVNTLLACQGQSCLPALPLLSRTRRQRRKAMRMRAHPPARRAWRTSASVLASQPAMGTRSARLGPAGVCAASRKASRKSLVPAAMTTACSGGRRAA